VFYSDCIYIKEIKQLISFGGVKMLSKNKVHEAEVIIKELENDILSNDWKVGYSNGICTIKRNGKEISKIDIQNKEEVWQELCLNDKVYDINVYQRELSNRYFVSAYAVYSQDNIYNSTSFSYWVSIGSFIV
jgi:hypothetical protein